MNKSLLSMVFSGMAGVYLLLNFLGERDNITNFNRGVDNTNLSTKGEERERKRVDFDSEDVLGRDILYVKYETKSVQIEAWNNSKFKRKFLNLFPDFEEMKYFVSEYTRGDELQEYLVDKIDSVESDFFSGKINSEEAYRNINYTY